MKYDRSSSGSIPVASESEVARWTRGRSRHRTRPMEAVEVDGRPQTFFVADQLLVDGRDRDLVDYLVERYGAEVSPRKPLPPAPKGLGPKSGVVVEDMPLPVLLRVNNAPAASKRAAELLRASFSSTMSVTSESAARLAGRDIWQSRSPHVVAICALGGRHPFTRHCVYGRPACVRTDWLATRVTEFFLFTVRRYRERTHRAEVESQR